MQSLLSDRIRCWKEPILVSYLFLGLLLKRRPGLHTPFPNAWSKKQNIPSSTWPGGHISYAESKHIYCSFISIYHKLSLLRQADAKPQFASKVSSLDVANSPRSLSHVTQPLKTSLVTLPPLQTVARRGPHRHLSPVVLKTICWCQYRCGPWRGTWRGHDSYFARWSCHNWSRSCSLLSILINNFLKQSLRWQEEAFFRPRNLAFENETWPWSSNTCGCAIFLQIIAQGFFCKQ